MEVAPVLAPDDRLVFPPRVGAGERELQTLGKGRLARAVASGDDGQAGSGLQEQRRLRADAAEALDGDLGEVGTGRFAGLLDRCGEGLDEFAAGGAPAEDFGQVLRGFQCGEDDEAGLFAEVRVFVGTGQYVVLQPLIRHASTSRSAADTATNRRRL